YTKINELYAQLKDKLQRNKDAKLDSAEIEKQTTVISSLLLEQNLAEAIKTLEEANKNLDTQWSTYQAYLIKKPTTQSPPPASNSYQSGSTSTSMVSTITGSFSATMVKYPPSQVRVQTVSGSNKACRDTACTSKPLASYVVDHGGFAGINGPYFCPPD